MITNDRDFKPILDSPATFKAKYLLAPRDGNLADLDAINRTYPSLKVDGAGIATLDKELDEIGCPTFGLYAIHETP